MTSFKVCWSDRGAGDTILNAHVSADGTDCPIREPSDFSPAWFSHKLNAAAFRFEIAVSVYSGNAVWAHGPWSAGVPDLVIFRAALKERLEAAYEFAVADDGYSYLRCIQPPGEAHSLHKPLKLLRTRHENYNQRLKI